MAMPAALDSAVGTAQQLPQSHTTELQGCIHKQRQQTLKEPKQQRFNPSLHHYALAPHKPLQPTTALCTIAQGWLSCPALPPVAGHPSAQQLPTHAQPTGVYHASTHHAKPATGQSDNMSQYSRAHAQSCRAVHATQPPCHVSQALQARQDGSAAQIDRG